MDKRQSASTHCGRLATSQLSHRTAQMVWLNDETFWSAAWWAHKRAPFSDQILSDICDESLSWFLESAVEYRESFPEIAEQQRHVLWVNSWLLECAEEYAKRHNTSLKGILCTALTLYVKEFGPTPTDEQIERLRRLKAVARAGRLTSI